MAKSKKITFKVSGMSCNGCAASIGRAVSRLDGVEEATADYPKGIAEVQFKENVIDKEKIIATIHELGYKVEGEV